VEQLKDSGGLLPILEFKATSWRTARFVTAIACIDRDLIGAATASIEGEPT
jgi:hypothetical protein